MIQGNELRVGNLVKTRFGILTIESISDFEVNFGLDCRDSEGYKLKEIDPIPITPRMLELVGFELYGYGGQGNCFVAGKKRLSEDVCSDEALKYRIYLEIFQHQDGGCDLSKWNVNFLLMGKTIFTFPYKISYLHELQNIYKINHELQKELPVDVDKLTQSQINL